MSAGESESESENDIVEIEEISETSYINQLEDEFGAVSWSLIVEKGNVHKKGFRIFF